MGYRNREIEKKFLAPGLTLEEGMAKIRSALTEWDSILTDASRDYYWSPRGLNADFIRLRYMPEGDGQLTIKQADKDGNTDRVEIDVRVDDPDQCRKLLEHLMGPPTGSIYKEYHVFFLDKRDTTISLYRVRGDKRVFVEVEARTIERVERLEKLVGTVMSLERELRSLYQIFVAKE